jgi:hypothetical protein
MPRGFADRRSDDEQKQCAATIRQKITEKRTFNRLKALHRHSKRFTGFKWVTRIIYAAIAWTGGYVLFYAIRPCALIFPNCVSKIRRVPMAGETNVDQSAKQKS